MQTPNRSSKAPISSENVLQNAPLENGQLLPENKEESDELAIQSVFRRSSKLKCDTTIKVTTTSNKLLSRKKDSGPVCNNILLKSQDRKHTLKTDWLDKCQPFVKGSAKSSNNNDIPQRHNNVDEFSDEKSLKKEQKGKEDLFPKTNRNCESNVESEEVNIAEKASKCNMKEKETDLNIVDKSLDDEKQLCSTREYSTNQDMMPSCSAPKEPRNKRKRTAKDPETCSKRIKQSEEEEGDSRERPAQQLSSFEAFAYPDDEDVDEPEHSSKVRGQVGKSKQQSSENSRLGSDEESIGQYEEDSDDEDKSKKTRKAKVKKSAASSG